MVGAGVDGTDDLSESVTVPRHGIESVDGCCLNVVRDVGLRVNEFGDVRNHIGLVKEEVGLGVGFGDEMTLETRGSGRISFTRPRKKRER